MSALDRFKAPFDVLGLDPTASNGEIDKQRRRLVLQVHPDKTRGDEATIKANEAKTKEYNRAHEQAISLLEDPLFQRFKTIFLQDKISKEEHKKTAEKHKRKKEELDRRHEKHKCFFRMIDIISDQAERLSDNYNDSEFKQKTGTWTVKQYQKASDAVQYGLSNSRKNTNTSGSTT